MPERMPTRRIILTALPLAAAMFPVLFIGLTALAATRRDLAKFLAGGFLGWAIAQWILPSWLNLGVQLVPSPLLSLDLE